MNLKIQGLKQWSKTGGSWTTGGPRKNLGGPL